MNTQQAFIYLFAKLFRLGYREAEACSGTMIPEQALIELSEKKANELYQNNHKTIENLGIYTFLYDSQLISYPTSRE